MAVLICHLLDEAIADTKVSTEKRARRQKSLDYKDVEPIHAT